MIFDQEHLTARAKQRGECIVMTVEANGLWTFIPISQELVNEPGFDWTLEWKRLWTDARAEALKEAEEIG